MTSRRPILAATLAAALAACGKTATPDFAGGTPDAAGLTLETQGGSTDGLASTPSSGAAALTVTPDAVTATACPATPASYEWTCQIRQSVIGINRFVRAAVEPVEALVAAGGASSPSEDVRVYGPAALPAAAPVARFTLTVRFLGNDTFRWKLEAAPVAGGTARVVMAGQLHRGDLPHRGRGFIGIDLDQLHAVNAAAFTGQGKLLAAFAHAGAAKALVYAAQAFSADGVASPVSAVFTGWKDALGRARVRLAAKGELLAPVSGADAGDELLLSRIGYWPALGGRTAAVVLQGDVASYGGSAPNYSNLDVKAFLGLECFGAGLDVTYRALWVCGTNTSTSTNECRPVDAFNTDTAKAIGTDVTGLPVAGACVPNTDLYDAATGVGTDPNATALEPGAPAAPDAPPAVMPSF
jgi:hypothetical protein